MMQVENKNHNTRQYQGCFFIPDDFRIVVFNIRIQWFYSPTIAISFIATNTFSASSNGIEEGRTPRNTRQVKNLENGLCNGEYFLPNPVASEKYSHQR
jgi:hypothetical protein